MPMPPTPTPTPTPTPDPIAPGIVAVYPLVLCIPVTRDPGISITAVHIGGAAGVIVLVTDGDTDLSLRGQRQTGSTGEKHGK